MVLRHGGFLNMKPKKTKKIVLPKDATLEELRWRRDLAAKDGQLDLAFACALAIDRKKGL